MIFFSFKYLIMSALLHILVQLTRLRQPNLIPFWISTHEVASEKKKWSRQVHCNKKYYKIDLGQSNIINYPKNFSYSCCKAVQALNISLTMLNLEKQKLYITSTVSTVMKLPVFRPSIELLLMPAGLLGSIALGAAAGFEGGASFTGWTSGCAVVAAGFGASPPPKR